MGAQRDRDERRLAAPHQVFVARQPILDARRELFAYELLFRPSSVATASATASSEASARVITDAVVSFGLDTLAQGRPAFINVTREMLVEGMLAALPPGRVVLEVLETIDADPDVLGACQRLRAEGYRIALDDFVLHERTRGLLRVADFIKLEVGDTSDPANRRDVLAASRSYPVALLAEKVETPSQFERARREGFQYFQGFFFGRPETQGARAVPADRIGYVRLLRALGDPDLTVQKLEDLVRPDPLLCFRVLRTVNSAGFAQATRIASIRQALVLLGVAAVRRWVALWALAGLSDQAHPEVLVMAAVRARTCEILAARQRGPETAAAGFLLGLCSLLDAVLQIPMPALLDSLPLPPEVLAALRGDDTADRRLLECVIAHEQAAWTRAASLAAVAGIDPESVAVAYQEALQWAAESRRSQDASG